MTGLRKITEELGILLIFDEVKTGFEFPLVVPRKSMVKPDLTALGKVLGGGFPVGAVGGKEEIWGYFPPMGKKNPFEMDVRTNNKSSIS